MTTAAILLVLLIALPMALRRPEASSQTVSAIRPSADALEAHRASQAVVAQSPWEGLSEIIERHNEQVRAFLAAVSAAEARVAAAEKAAAHEQWHREQDAKKAAAARAVAVEQTTTAAAASKPASPAPAARSASGNCGGWEGLISSHFSDVGTACRVMMCESEGNPRAQNPSGASGLFQVMPAWADRYQQVTGVPYYDGRFDPNASTRFAAYLVNAEGWASQFDCY